MMWGWNGGGWSGGGAWGLVSGLLMLLFFAALVVGLILIVRALLGYQSRSPYSSQSAPPVGRGYTAPTALEILEQRYAKGEIEREEFLARKNDLQS